MSQYSLGKLIAFLGADTTDFQKGLLSASVSMKKTGKQMSAIGKQMSMSLSVPLLAAGTAMSLTASNFEKSLNQVAAVTQATEGQMSQLTSVARELGKSTKFSAQEAADAMSFLAMAGFSVDETIKALPSTLNLAAAGNMDLAESADIVSNVMQGFGIQAKNTGEVVDIMSKTFTTSNTNLSQLGLAMSYVAPVAKAFGQNITSTSAAIGVLSDAGIQGTRAGTGLRQILTQLAKKADILGFSVYGTNGKMLPLVDILKNVEDAGVSTEEMISKLGTRAGTAFVTLMDRGSDSLRSFTTDLDDSGGTAQRIAETQMKGLAGAFTELKSAFSELFISFASGGFLSMLEGAIDSFKGLVLSISNMNESVRNAILVIGGVVAAIGPLLVIVGIFVSSVLPALMTGLAALTGPIGLIVLGITAASVAFVKLRSEAQKGNEILNSTKDVVARASAEYSINKTRVDNLVTSLKELNSKEHLSSTEIQVKKDIISELNTKYGKYLDNQITEKTSLDDLNDSQKLINEGLHNNIILKAKASEMDAIATKKLNTQREAYEDLNDILENAGVSSIAERASIISEAFEKGLSSETALWDKIGSRTSTSFQKTVRILADYSSASQDATKATEYLNAEFDTLIGKTPVKPISFISKTTIEDSKEFVEIQKKLKDINEEVAALPYNELIPQSLIDRAAEYKKQLQELQEEEENEDPVKSQISNYEELTTAYSETKTQIQDLLAQGSPIPEALITSAINYKKEIDAVKDSLLQLKILGSILPEENSIASLSSISAPSQIAEQGVTKPITGEQGMELFPSPSPEDIAGVDQYATTWENAAIRIEEAIKQAAVAALAGSAEMLGFMAASGAGVGEIAANIGVLVGGTLADLMIQVGKIAIGVGIAIEGIKEALLSLNPVVAVAAGVALVALGGFVKGQLKKAANPQGLATGGNVITSGAFMVGEEGPELVNLPRGSAVTPNHALQSSGGGQLVARVSGKELEFVLNEYKSDKLRY